MTTTYDVVVLGLGAMGSAVVHHLARRGVRVLGVDRHAPPHTLGSTHGRSRIIREAYYEHPAYVPLVRRAYDAWDALEAEWGRPLFLRTGALMLGPADGTLVGGATRSAREHGVAHQTLDAAEVRRRFPAYAPPDDHVALLEHRAGVLLPEACVEAHLTLAQRDGAELWTDCAVTAWREDGDGVRVETARGAVTAARLVVAAGPWLPTLLAAHGAATLPLVVERQLSHWFTPGGDASRFAPERCPLALWEHAPGHLFASFPDLGDGVKCGAHHDGSSTDPAHVDRTVHPDEIEAAHTQLARLLPNDAWTHRESRVCLYTNTPDAHFVLDTLPGEPTVLVASACSGHGFKFSSAIGALMADLVTGSGTDEELEMFAAGRFA